MELVACNARSIQGGRGALGVLNWLGEAALRLAHLARQASCLFPAHPASRQHCPRLQDQHQHCMCNAFSSHKPKNGPACSSGAETCCTQRCQGSRSCAPLPHDSSMHVAMQLQAQGKFSVVHACPELWLLQFP